MKVCNLFFLVVFFFAFPCFTQNISIIISNWPLWSECTASSVPTMLNSAAFGSNFQGFLIDIFTNSLPSSYIGNISFYCYEWNETLTMLSNIASNQLKDQSIFLGPITSKIANSFNASFLSSYPIYSSHLYMIEQPTITYNNYFYYLMGFDIKLWFFIVFLVIVFSHFLWIFERSDDNKMPLKYLEGIKEAMWQILLYMFFMVGRPIRSFSGRALICSMLFTSYILMVNFLCSTVSRMLNTYENMNFVNLKDLGNSDMVYSFDEYEDFIKLNNPAVMIKTFPWGLDTQMNFLNFARKGTGHLLLPNFLADSAINNSCLLKKSSDFYLSNFYLSFLATRNIDLPFFSSLNQGIISFRSSYKYLALYNLRFLPNLVISECNNTNIDFSEMYGIWIIFSSGILLSIFSFGVRIFFQKWLKIGDSYEKIFGKNPLRRGFKRLIYEEKKLIQQALIEYFERILMIYESKHKEILKTLKGVVEEKRDSIEKVEEKLKDLYTQLE